MNLLISINDLSLVVGFLDTFVNRFEESMTDIILTALFIPDWWPQLNSKVLLMIKNLIHQNKIEPAISFTTKFLDKFDKEFNFPRERISFPMDITAALILQIKSNQSSLPSSLFPFHFSKNIHISLFKE